MYQLFSDAWMTALKEKWNASPQVHAPLKAASFSARIGYGFKGEAHARGMLHIVDGMVQQACEMIEDVHLDWDLRASPENWLAWIENGFGLIKLGPAIATNSLEFAKGDYRQMIKNPSLSHPFLQHFQLMGKIDSGVTAEREGKKKSWF